MQILATENADKAAVQASAKTATPFGIQSLADAWTKVDVDEEPRVLLSPVRSCSEHHHHSCNIILVILCY